MDPALERMVALAELQFRTNSGIPVTARYRQHMRAPVDHSISYCRCRIHKSDESVSIERAKDETTDMDIRHEVAGGHDVDIGRSPGFALQIDTRLELGDLVKRPNRHVEIVSDLAFCQSASISPSDACSRVFPCFANSPSMY